MSLAELSRESFQGSVRRNLHRRRWLDDFLVEEVGGGEDDFLVEEVGGDEDEISAPPPVDSKILFRESAKLPNSDRVQTNIGRILHVLLSRDICGRTHRPTEALESDWVVAVPGTRWIGEAKIEHRPENEQVLAKSAELLSKIASQPPDELIAILRQLVLGGRGHSSSVSQTEVVLESFDGYVDRAAGNTAYVTLESREHGDVLYGEYSAPLLLHKGIEEQSRFLCKTVKVGETTQVDFEKLPDAEVTDEEVRDIAEKIDRAFPRDDVCVY